jgi:hypothetical protein
LFLSILQPHSRDHRHCVDPFQEKCLRHICTEHQNHANGYHQSCSFFVLHFNPSINLLYNLGKDKLVMEIHSDMNVWLHLLTSTPYGNKWPHSRPGHFTPGVRSFRYPRASLFVSEKIKASCLCLESKPLYRFHVLL